MRGAKEEDFEVFQMSSSVSSGEYCYWKGKKSENGILFDMATLRAFLLAFNGMGYYLACSVCLHLGGWDLFFVRLEMG